MLEVLNVTKCYNKKKALDNFSVKLDNGIYGILGPNGAGKTTLISIIVNLLPPTNGKVMYNSTDITKLRDKYLDKIGYCPQYPRFYNNYKANEFLMYICAIKGIDKSKRKQKVTELLEFVNLSDDKNKKIGAFSGGMRQRLGIAQAMINNPEILILDEPTAGLDPKERIRFRNLISKLSEDRIILLATHIVSDVEFIAKEVLIIKKGVLLKKDSPQNLINDINSNVWEAQVPFNQFENFMSQHIVSNANHNDNGYCMRVISNDKPTEDAKNIQPNLEDVYLYYFGEALS